MSGRQAKKERGPKLRPYLHAAWASFRSLYLPPSITEREVRASRNTFMAGAATSLRLLRDAFDEDMKMGFVGDSRLVAEINRQTKELQDYQDAANLEAGIHKELTRNRG